MNENEDLRKANANLTVERDEWEKKYNEVTGIVNNYLKETTKIHTDFQKEWSELTKKAIITGCSIVTGLCIIVIILQVLGIIKI